MFNPLIPELLNNTPPNYGPNSKIQIIEKIASGDTKVWDNLNYPTLSDIEKLYPDLYKHIISGPVPNNIFIIESILYEHEFGIKIRMKNNSGINHYQCEFLQQMYSGNDRFPDGLLTMIDTELNKIYEASPTAADSVYQKIRNKFRITILSMLAHNTTFTKTEVNFYIILDYLKTLIPPDYNAIPPFSTSIKEYYMDE